MSSYGTDVLRRVLQALNQQSIIWTAVWTVDWVACESDLRMLSPYSVQGIILHRRTS
ncbi:MAG: hypothetical protein JWP34_4509 [Massilia sp.]|nr:hypothetical protein [Massilia sp.]